MTNESPKTKQTGRSWSGRLAAVLIFLFIGFVLTLMFFAARGPR